MVDCCCGTLHNLKIYISISVAFVVQHDVDPVACMFSLHFKCHNHIALNNKHIDTLAANMVTLMYQCTSGQCKLRESIAK